MQYCKPENVDQTNLGLISGKLVLQKMYLLFNSCSNFRTNFARPKFVPSDTNFETSRLRTESFVGEKKYFAIFFDRLRSVRPTETNKSYFCSRIDSSVEDDDDVDVDADADVDVDVDAVD